MKILDIIFTIISWLLCIFFIGLIGTLLESEIFMWVAGIIVGFMFGRYLDKTFSKGK